MENCKRISLTEDQYRHLPSDLHRLVVDALVAKGECIIHASEGKESGTH